MSRKANFARTVDAEAQRRFSQRVMLLAQIGLDAAAISANEVLSLGPSRAQEFSRVYGETFNEIIAAINGDTPDLEHTFDVLDRRLRQIYGDELVPAAVRYAK